MTGAAALRTLLAALAAFAAAFMSFGSAAAEDDQPIAVVPFRLDYGGLITVQTTIDGRGPYDFVIDTGATLTIAFENLAMVEALPPTGGSKKRILGITGSAEFDTHHFGTVGIGQASMEDHVGVIVPDWEAPRKSPAGIIGLDFLRQYAVVFDVDARTMKIYPHGGIPKSAIKGWRTTKLQRKTFTAATGALYTTSAAINYFQATFIVDTGSVSTLINYNAAESLFSGAVSRDLGEGFTTGSRLRDLFDDRTHARTALIYRVQIGRTIWRNVGVWVKDAEIFDEMQVQRLSYGLLGLDLLSTQNFAFDFGEDRLYLSKRQRRSDG